MAMKPKYEKNNSRLKAAFLEVVDNQLNANDPPETRQTFERLIAQGISREDAIIFIAQAVCLEVFCIIKNKETYNRARYVKNLQRLPKEPKK